MNHPHLPCRNLNHGRANVSVNFCPECGQRFASRGQGISSSSTCDAQKHMDYRKQRLNFCMNCGAKLQREDSHGKR